MPLPVITDVIRVAVRGVCPSGQPWVNVLHFRASTGTTLAANAALIQPEIAKLYSVVGYGASKAGWASNASTQSKTVDVTYLPLDGVSASLSNSMAITGAAGGDALPSDVAMVITHRTLLRGARHRGRSYWAGFAESVNGSDGRIITGTITDFLGCWGAFNAALVTKAIPQVVASYKFASAEPVSSYAIDTAWDRQRRRTH